MIVKWQCADDYSMNICEYSPFMCCTSCGRQYDGEQLYTYEENTRTVKVTEKDAFPEKMRHFIRDRHIRYVFEITETSSGETVVSEEDCYAVRNTVWQKDAMNCCLDSEAALRQGYRFISIGMNGMKRGYIFFQEKTGSRVWLSEDTCKKYGFLKSID